MDTIAIGGKEVEVQLKYLQVRKVVRVYNNMLTKIQEGQVIPDHFFFWSVWKCLVFKPVWFYHRLPFPLRTLFSITMFPFRKPFRTMRGMMKQTDKAEYMKMISFVGDRILEISEDKESGNVRH